ncbi:PREDICTED: uncharacterized protein LOC106808101 isoform X2 [Priapulus caudatus]|uniref:Uncharacterized protein LOC106808101 isoform X2 n=1 Tax=Priapulus caudatus TaxID=37621 RepID=A0ABM1E1T9_PRICU|nr:PREDICTED: uncharacterized protein LOC106808101 isoform X2 [Priapulus caudatus]
MFAVKKPPLRNMDAAKRESLIKNRDEIVERTQPHLAAILARLLEEGVVGQHIYDIISAKPTPAERAAKLVHILLEKDNRTYDVFASALHNNDLADLARKMAATAFEIETDLPANLHAVELHIEEKTLRILEGKLEGRPHSRGGGDSVIEAALHRGKVPPAAHYLSSPPAEIKDLLQKIVVGIGKLRNRRTPGFTLVYGDVETKSESDLTAAAMHVPELWQTTADGQADFPSDVIWQKIDIVRDDAELFLKTKTILSRLDEKYKHHRQPTCLADAHIALQQVLTNNPHCLLILEDVRSFKVIEHFNVHPRTLVTTHDKQLVDRVKQDLTSALVDLVYVGTSSTTYVPNFRDSVFRRSAGPMDAGGSANNGSFVAHDDSTEEPTFAVQPIETDALRTTPKLRPDANYRLHIAHEIVYVTPAATPNAILYQWRYECIREYSSRPAMFYFKSIDGREERQFRFKTEPGKGKELHEKMRIAARRRMEELSQR